MVKTDGCKEEKKKNKCLKDKRREEYNARDKELHKGKLGNIWSPNFLFVVTIFAFSFFSRLPMGMTHIETHQIHFIIKGSNAATQTCVSRVCSPHRLFVYYSIHLPNVGLKKMIIPL